MACFVHSSSPPPKVKIDRDPQSTARKLRQHTLNLADTEYHEGVYANSFLALHDRLMQPGLDRDAKIEGVMLQARLNENRKAKEKEREKGKKAYQDERRKAAYFDEFHNTRTMAGVARHVGQMRSSGRASKDGERHLTTATHEFLAKHGSSSSSQHNKH